MDVEPTTAPKGSICGFEMQTQFAGPRQAGQGCAMDGQAKETLHPEIGGLTPIDGNSTSGISPLTFSSSHKIDAVERAVGGFVPLEMLAISRALFVYCHDNAIRASGLLIERFGI